MFVHALEVCGRHAFVHLARCSDVVASMAPTTAPIVLLSQSFVSQERPIVIATACNVSRPTDNALAATRVTTGRRVATAANRTGATNSTTFAINSTRHGVGNDQ